MIDQQKINEIVDDYAKAASFDYVGLWQIIKRVRHESGLSDRNENKKLVLQIICGLLSAGLEAVTLNSSGPGCTPWENQDLGYVLNRISTEWDNLDHDPNPGDIVWLNNKRSP
ncbi:MAG TPA: hypothetical protein VF901_01170 [Bradyrhizobium sp.]